jgi:transposase
MRDLCRAREEASRDRKTATLRLNAVLRRQEIRSTGRASGGPAHLRWRSEVVCPTPAPPSVCQAYVRAVTEHTARLERLGQELTAQVRPWRLRPGVDALHARRGIQCTVAVTAVAERGARSRVDHPSQLMRDLGLTPSAYATGDRRRQGGIPKAGNTQARRALVDGAWADRDPAHVRRHLQRRLEQVPKPIQDLRWKAQVRLCQRARQLSARGKHAHQVGVASARDLRALMGAMAQEGPLTPSTATVERLESVLTRL